MHTRTSTVYVWNHTSSRNIETGKCILLERIIVYIYISPSGRVKVKILETILEVDKEGLNVKGTNLPISTNYRDKRNQEYRNEWKMYKHYKGRTKGRQ